MAFTIAAVQGAAAQSLINVPPEHWCYRFLERFEVKGVLNGLGDGIKPMSRRAVSEALQQVSTAAASGYELSAVEHRHLELLMSEFSPERQSAAGTVRRRGIGERLRRGEPLFSYRDDRGQVNAELLARSQSDFFTGRRRNDSERIYRNRLGGVIRGDVKGVLQFRASFEQAREEGSRSYHLRDDVYEPRLELPQLKGNRVDYHEGTAYFAFGTPFVDVQVGKDVASWGPARVDNLGLSNNAPSFDMVRLNTRLGSFKLVSIAGFLRPCPDRPDSPLCSGVSDGSTSYVVNNISRTLDRDKYLAAHRMEVRLARWIDVGFQEVVVYGDRGLELSYLNPLMFYWAAQSYLGDKDNLMMGVDLDIHPGNGLRLYLAYVADDLKKLRLFTNDFANKFSFQSGLLWVDPWGMRDSEIEAQYVRIEPWIFTHKFPINTFRHFDAPLGHSLGPNSDRWWVKVGRYLARDVRIQLDVSRTRHAENVMDEDGQVRNVGGDLHRGWRPGDERETKDFLAGKLSKWIALGAQLEVRMLPQVDTAITYRMEWGTSVPLPPRWDPNITLSQRTGYGDGRQQQFSIDLRYNLL